MKADQENNLHNPPIVNETVTEKVIKSVIFILFVTGLARFLLSYYTTAEEKVFEINNTTEINQTINITEINGNITQDVKVAQNMKQPSCSNSKVILKEICADLVLKKYFCTPEDFYNKNKHRNPTIYRKKSLNNEPKAATIMNYVVSGLLITSLGAALVELYKAKKQESKKNSKSPLSRKSSLADLTVLKHQRKELIRRDSILEVPEESPHSKQLGSTPPSLQHRCSFPVGVHESDVATNEEETAGTIGDVSTITIRKTSVNDVRRQSTLERRTSIDYRAAPADAKRLSVDDSPERRHHRHLVHRH